MQFFMHTSDEPLDPELPLQRAAALVLAVLGRGEAVQKRAQHPLPTGRTRARPTARRGLAALRQNAPSSNTTPTAARSKWRGGSRPTKPAAFPAAPRSPKSTVTATPPSTEQARRFDGSFDEFELERQGTPSSRCSGAGNDSSDHDLRLDLRPLNFTTRPTSTTPSTPTTATTCRFTRAWQRIMAARS